MKIELVMDQFLNGTRSLNSNAIMLKEKGGSRKIMLALGLYEAQGIATSLQSIVIERPLTQDLFEPITAAFGIKLNYIEVNDIVDGTLHALLCYERDGEEKFIDARMSDALAIALRVDAPIYIEEEMLNNCLVTDEGGGRFSIPASFARIQTLREALDLAVAEEKYELARQLKDEIEARTKAFGQGGAVSDAASVENDGTDNEE